MLTVEADWWLTDILISCEGSAVTDCCNLTVTHAMSSFPAHLFQVDAGGGGVLWQQVRGPAGGHQMAKCQLFQTLSQVRVWVRNPGAEEQLMHAGPWEKMDGLIPYLTAGSDCCVGTFLRSHLLLESSVVSNNPPLCRLVITSHWAGSSFSSWLRNPLPTFGINLNIFWGGSHRPPWLPVKTPRSGSLNAAILMSLISPTREWQRTATRRGSAQHFLRFNPRKPPCGAGVVKPRGSAAQSHFTLKVRRPPPRPLWAWLILVLPTLFATCYLPTRPNCSGWLRPHCCCSWASWRWPSDMMDQTLGPYLWILRDYEWGSRCIGP